jgi:hypothetical protein
MSDGHLNNAKVAALFDRIPSPVAAPDWRSASLIRDRNEVANGVSIIDDRLAATAGTDDEPSVDLVGRRFPKLTLRIVLTDEFQL